MENKDLKKILIYLVLLQLTSSISFIRAFLFILISIETLYVEHRIKSPSNSLTRLSLSGKWSYLEAVKERVDLDDQLSSLYTVFQRVSIYF